LRNKIQEFIQYCDIVLISGGSSMGEKDVTRDAINMLGEPGVFIHGLAVKPGKPTIVGKIGSKAVFGLPGQPVSALIIFHTLVKDLIYELYGIHQPQPYIVGQLATNIASAPGKEHYVMVGISQENNKNVVTPVHGKSGMLTMMTKSIGYIRIEQNQEGIYKGAEVKVFLF
jgi:molybdopterin molybdotransferase